MMTPEERAEIRERIATTPHESGLTKELMWRKSDLNKCLADLDEQEKEIERLSGNQKALEDCSYALFEALRFHWKQPDMSILMAYLLSFVETIKKKWLKGLPLNGFTCSATWPDIGKMEISIRRIEGKSAGEIINEQYAELEKLRAENAELRAASDHHGC